ncbi:hypothetical protein SDC9_195597 [bioreactor metagenome]|uniref:Uncharacterized protein n=1 Tax=bioreactor metagenome TaxID=1076179 RepID=A0A645IKZ1_9ZZZZ
MENNNATKGGPGTITASIFPLDEDGTTVLPDALATFTTQSNANIVKSGEVVVPEGVPGVQIKISKDWNIVYIDDVSFRLKVDLWSGTHVNTASSFRVIPGNNNSISFISTEKISSVRIINICGQTVLSSSEVSDHIILPYGAKGILIAAAKTESGATLISRFINK